MKWIIGGVLLLIAYVCGCYLWYQHEMTSFRKKYLDVSYPDASKLEKQVKSVAEKDTISATQDQMETPQEEQSETLDLVPKDTKQPDTQVEETSVRKTPVKNKKRRESPNGFGPFPKIPSDFPNKTFRWHHYTHDPDKELMARVKFKYWKENGIYAKGTSFRYGKVYLILPDTAYVHWKTKYTDDGAIMKRYISEILWAPANAPSSEQVLSSGLSYSDYLRDVINRNNLKVVDFHDAGIDPYSYLNIKGN